MEINISKRLSKKFQRSSVFVALLLLAMLVVPIQGWAASPPPSLVWNTFLGGSKLDVAKGIVSDAEGNLYVTGYSYSSWGSPVNPFIGAEGYTDAFVAKLDANGNRVWSTFLGGVDYDQASDITLDVEGNLYVAGYSTSCEPQYPCYRVFVTKLDANGNLIWNTFEGGPGSDRDRAFAITSDAEGNIYVAGDSGGHIGFVSKLDVNGNRLWSAFLGTGYDLANGIALDEEENLYVTGYSRKTWGSPVNPHSGDGMSDAFVSRLDANGNLMWNTFMGGPSGDYAYAIASNTEGKIYVTGYSNAAWGSPASPFTDKSDAFVAKLDANGNRIWNTFMGGAGYDRAYGIALDAEGNLYVAGDGGPSWGSPVNPHSGEVDGFVARLDANGNLMWNTFLGSSDNDWNEGIASDAEGNLYVVGHSDATWGYPVNPYSGSLDVFVAKISTTVKIIPPGGCFPYIPDDKMLMICW